MGPGITLAVQGDVVPTSFCNAKENRCLNFHTPEIMHVKAVVMLKDSIFVYADRDFKGICNSGT